MKHLIPILVSCVLAITLSTIPNTFAYTIAPFEENFDGALSGWQLLKCYKHINDIDGRQSCSIGQSVVSNPKDLTKDAKSSPYWGYIQIKSDYSNCIEKTHYVKYQKSFQIEVPDIYDVSAWIATSPCVGCKKTSQLLIDGEELLSQKSTTGTPELVKNKIDLNPGIHTVTLVASTDRACTGEFRSSFDDIRVEREITQSEYDAAAKAREDAAAKAREDAAAKAREDAAAEKARIDAADEKARQDAAAEKARIDAADEKARIDAADEKARQDAEKAEVDKNLLLLKKNPDSIPAPDRKITICHYPPGNTIMPQTISVAESGWSVHEKHGDILGNCPDETPYQQPPTSNNKNPDSENKNKEPEDRMDPVTRVIDQIKQFLNNMEGLFSWAA